MVVVLVRVFRSFKLIDLNLQQGASQGFSSRAIGDALAVDPVPTVEVHLSDVQAREEWRKISVFEGLTAGVVAGKGPDGYREALEILAGLLGTA